MPRPQSRLARFIALFVGPPRVWGFIAVVASASAGIWAFDLARFGPLATVGNISLTWWELAVGFYLAEAFVVHMQFRKQAHTLSLTEIGLVLGLFLASPANLLIGQVVGATLALAVNRRQKPIKLAFNVAELPLCTGLALLIFRSFGDASGSNVRLWAFALVATAVAHSTGVGLVSAVIGVAEGKFVAPQLSRTLRISLVGALATTCLGLAAVELIEKNAIAGLLLVVPVVACGLAFRGYMQQREQREHVEFLYESMRATQGAPEFGLAVGQLLVAARRLLRAEYAEILLVSPTPGEPLLRSISGPTGETLMHPEAAVSPVDELAFVHVGAANRSTLLGRRRDEHPLDAFVRSRTLKDAVIGPLRGENGLFGLMLVGDRAGDVSTFSDDDLDLFETFVGHSSVLLENGRLEHSLAQVTELKEQLHHQAYHDGLTGLPNRASFAETVVQQLADRRNGSSLAVLYLDLDRFKAVNDSWGHEAGDELLGQVAERIRRTIRPGDTPARLGGDEFAVLLDGADAEVAKRTAQRLSEALSSTFSLASGETTVHASIGIAVSGPDAPTAEDLIRNADIAMYSSKRVKRQRYALYEPSLHARLRDQRQLALDLELAVEREEIVVHYQPIISLVDGSLVAFEALGRWQHPERGLLQPAEFLGLAEDNGLIVEIGLNVCEQAIACLDTLSAASKTGSELGMWINLAPAELTNERLVENLAVELTRTGVDARRLTLEITESSLIRDEDGALKAMRRLRDLGVHLSVDDFGTGYSSLSRLADFPIETLKIPKAFIDKLTDEAADDTFVSAILRLAESLGLATVGEGIEHLAQLQSLQQLGCGMGQGFLFSRPLVAQDAARLVALPAAEQRFLSAAHVRTLAVADGTLDLAVTSPLASAGTAG